MTRLNRREWWLYQCAAMGFVILILVLDGLWNARFPMASRISAHDPTPFALAVVALVMFLLDIRRAKDTDMVPQTLFLVIVSYLFCLVDYLLAPVQSWHLLFPIFIYRGAILATLMCLPSTGDVTEEADGSLSPTGQNAAVSW